jgi:hypothetical protein
MMTFKTQANLIAAIKSEITTNDAAAIRALLRVYEYQTADEQANGFVSNLNGVGFVHTDSEILTSFVNQLNRRGSLSVKQMAVLKRLIGKYAGQLFRQARDKGFYKKEGGVWVVVPPQPQQRAAA